MADEQHPHPEAFGIDALTHLVKEMRADMRAGFHRLERMERAVMGQLGEMDAKLENIANQETQLGVDIQTVVDALKAIPNPPTDLTAQLAKLDGISQKLIDTSASTLANLPPTPPVPVPARRR